MEGRAGQGIGFCAACVGLGGGGGPAARGPLCGDPPPSVLLCILLSAHTPCFRETLLKRTLSAVK